MRCGDIQVKIRPFVLILSLAAATALVLTCITVLKSDLSVTYRGATFCIVILQALAILYGIVDTQRLLDVEEVNNE